MAFSKYAKSRVVKSSIDLAAWTGVREAPRVKTGSKIVLESYDPKQYLLSHATIIASVDTEDAGMPTGRQQFDGQEIDRRYPDFYITPETSKYVNNNCFVPGTMILMGDGTEKPIEDILVGDRVITHKGRVQTVLETYKTPFKGRLKVIKRLGDQRLLEVTPEHPILAMTPPIQCACGCGTALDRRSKKAAVHRFQDFVQGHAAKGRKRSKPDFTWVSAGILGKGDFLSAPRLEGTIPCDVTPGKARLLGYYLAEGFYRRVKPRWASQRYKDAFATKDKTTIPVAVAFGLNLDETDTLVSEIRSLLKSEFGVGSNVQRVTENGVTVTSNQSEELVQFIKDHATEYSKTKKLSEVVLQWPLELQREVVRGWVEGDGCVESTAGGWVTAASASSDLISQMHVIFGRLGIFATRGTWVGHGRKRVRVANGNVQIVDDLTKICTSHRLQIGSVHAASLLGGSHLEALYQRSIRDRKKHTLRYRVDEHRTMFPVRSVEERAYEGFVYNFETDVDHSYVANGVTVHNCDAWERQLLLDSYHTFIGGSNYLEHVQVPSLSKGRIIDAIARDLGDTVYVDILVATDKKHKDLVAAIISGKLNTLSMGATVEDTTCTRCGNVAADEPSLCQHIKFFKGNEFIDALGKRRKIAELCGNKSAKGSCKFIEASWVENPAFEGAVLRNILESEDVPGASGKIQLAFSHVPFEVDPTRLQKAAAQQEQFPGADKTKDKKDESPEKSDLDKAVDKLYKDLQDKLVERVNQDTSKDNKGDERFNTLDENRNENLIKSAVQENPRWAKVATRLSASIEHPSTVKKILAGLILLARGGWPAVQESRQFTGQEILVIDRLASKGNRKSSTAGESRIYRTVVAVGGTNPYRNVNDYLSACRRVVGRDLTDGEKQLLIVKGHLFSIGTVEGRATNRSY